MVAPTTLAEIAVKLPTLVLLALCLLARLPDARADGLYLTGSAGQAHWGLDCGNAGCSRNPGAWRVAAGWQLNRVVAFEAFHIDLGRARSSDFSTDGTLAARGPGVQALVGWDFGAFGMAGKIGVARLRIAFDAAPTSSYTSQRLHSNEVIGGFVLAWHATPNLSVRFDADIVTVALNGDALYYSRGGDVVTSTLGMVLRF